MAAVVDIPRNVEDNDVRVADYLDDKLQTFADLETLDYLLQGVRSQQVLLQKQLHDANQDLHDAETARQEHQASVRTRADKFLRDQKDIDRRLMAITQSETSDEAVVRFEASMSKLRRLDIAEGYVNLLQETDRLSTLCLENLAKNDVASLNAYIQMHELASSLPRLQDAAEGAAPHLLDHVLDTTKRLRSRVEETFSKQLEDVLRRMQWPGTDSTLPPDLETEFHEGVRKLLELQKPDLEAASGKTNHADGDATREPPLVLLPLQVMVRPMELIFRYHFESDKPTNRLDRPEYFLNHVTDKLLEQHADFMIDNIQPILSDVFRTSDISINAAHGDAVCAFITALLPMLRAKIFSILPKVAQKPQLLSHLIHQLMAFDMKLREEWNYDDGSNGGIWPGLTHEVLMAPPWFSTWLDVEKDFALARYQTIIDASDSRELEHESLPVGVTKPTKAAIRVNDLLEATTDNYRTLTSFSQRLRFLIDIQLAIFDKYHSQLLDHLNAYQIRNTRIGRTSREEQRALQGIQGLETLCKIYGSAEYLETAMRDWSDDVFFLDMWQELQQRAGAGGSAAATESLSLGRELTLASVAEVTSQTLGTEDAAETGSMFDETAGAYTKLRVRVEHILIDVLTAQLGASLAAYTRVNPWSSLAESARLTQPLPSTAELDPLLSVVREDFGFLGRTLGRLPLRRVARAAGQAIEEILFDRVLLARAFSAAGAAQLEADILAIRAAFGRVVEGAVVDMAMLRVSEGVRLVGLPIRGSKAAVGESAVGEDGEERGGDGEEGERAKLGLWEVEKRLFEAGGEVARACLAELGLERLTVAEARKVLARRVELSS